MIKVPKAALYYVSKVDFHPKSMNKVTLKKPEKMGMAYSVF